MHEPAWLNDIRLKLEIFTIAAASALAGMLYLAYGSGPLAEQGFLPPVITVVWNVSLVAGGLFSCVGAVLERLRLEMFGYVLLASCLTFLALAVATHMNSSSDVGLTAFLFGLALAVVNRAVITTKAIHVLECGPQQ